MQENVTENAQTVMLKGSTTRISADSTGSCWSLPESKKRMRILGRSMTSADMLMKGVGERARSGGKMFLKAEKFEIQHFGKKS